jgi:hypothetical protein
MQSDKQVIAQAQERMARLDKECVEASVYAHQMQAYCKQERQKLQDMCAASKEGHDYDSELDSDCHSCRRVYTCKRCGYWY